jgi:lysophospholipase L1-like esterase
VRLKRTFALSATSQYAPLVRYPVKVQWYEFEVQALENSLKGRVNGNRPPVFYGSSSFRLWDTLAEDFDPRVLNLAFGGSTLEACDYFFARLVPPVNPRSLLLYAGDNDLADGRSAEQVLAFFRSLADRVAVSLSAIPFGFVSVKPSPARYPIIDKIRCFNELVRKDIESRPAGYYVDIFPAMLDQSGKPRAEFFVDDGLHLNRKGYRLWSRLLEPHRNRIFIK